MRLVQRQGTANSNTTQSSPIDFAPIEHTRGDETRQDKVHPRTFSCTSATLCGRWDLHLLVAGLGRHRTLLVPHCARAIPSPHTVVFTATGSGGTASTVGTGVEININIWQIIIVVLVVVVVIVIGIGIAVVVEVGIDIWKVVLVVVEGNVWQVVVNAVVEAIMTWFVVCGLFGGVGVDKEQTRGGGGDVKGEVNEELLENSSTMLEQNRHKTLSCCDIAQRVHPTRKDNIMDHGEIHPHDERMRSQKHETSGRNCRTIVENVGMSSGDTWRGQGERVQLNWGGISQTNKQTNKI